MTFNFNNKSSKVLIGSIFILIIICSALGFITLNIQNKLNSLQSNYNQLATSNSNLQNNLNNLQSSLRQLDDDVAASNSQERISTNIIWTVNENTLQVSAQCLSGIDVVIVDAVLRDSVNNEIGNVIAQNNGQMQPQIIPASRTFVHFDVSFPTAHLASGYTYTVTLISQKGNSFTFPFTSRDLPNNTPEPQPSVP
jgi:hypothetical protein